MTLQLFAVKLTLYVAGTCVLASRSWTRWRRGGPSLPPWCSLSWGESWKLLSRLQEGPSLSKTSSLALGQRCGWSNCSQSAPSPPSPSAPPHLPWTHVSSLSSRRWSSCVGPPIPVWNTWTLNVSSPPWVCVCSCGCLRLSSWSAGSSSLLTSSGWLLLWYSYQPAGNGLLASPLGPSRVYLWCDWRTIQTDAEA